MVQETYDGPNGAKTWVKELQRRGDGDVTIALAGNKVDMKKHRQVDAEVNGLVGVFGCWGCVGCVPFVSTDERTSLVCRRHKSTRLQRTCCSLRHQRVMEPTSKQCSKALVQHTAWEGGGDAPTDAALTHTLVCHTSFVLPPSPTAKTLKKVPSAAKAAEDAVGLGSAAPPAESKGCCR